VTGWHTVVGGLLAGHLGLVRAAQETSDRVVVSLFVNPKQFAAGDDYKTYPRPLEDDLALLQKEGVDAVFVPTPTEMYSARFATYVDHEGINGAVGEAACRPGFFRGVATVCTKLFHIVRPDAVFFGQKDAQQCAVIRRIVADLDMDWIDVQVCPTAREPDGLAMSTRNAYLSAEQRVAAPVLFWALEEAKERYRWDTAGLSRADLVAEITQAVERRVGVECRIDYVSLADSFGQEIERGEPGAVLSAAMTLGKPGEQVRILDNVVLPAGGTGLRA
jgi:pantoate--beta-alanine ligase